MPFFLANWYLLFGLAAAVPVALHLLHRRRPRPVPFSTLRFLQEAVSTTRRSRHLTQVVALLLRVLLILLLALAFAQPQVRFSAFIPPGPRTVVIILDGSASMRFQDGTSTCFERGREWAERLIASLAEADRIALLVPGTPEPRLAFPPVSDHGNVVRSLREATPGYGQASLAEVLQDLSARLEEAGRPSLGTEIHVFSDFQASGWNGRDLETLATRLAAQRLVLFLNHVAPAVAANAGIVQASFQPPAILGDGEFEVRAMVQAGRDFQGTNSLKLRLGDEEASRASFDLRPNQDIRPSLIGRAGGNATQVQGELELEPDGFAEDNRFCFCLPRVPAIAVLLVAGGSLEDGGGRDTFFVRHALQPRGKASTLFQAATTDWSGLLAGDLEPYRAILACNPPAMNEAAVRKLEDFARGGGTVVLLPGQNHGLSAGLAAFEGLRGLRVEVEERAEAQVLALVASEPAADLERRLRAAMPAAPDIPVRRRLRFSAVPATAATAFQYADGGAFALRVNYGRGALWVTSVSANRDWSEWPLSPCFVLFLQELIKGSVPSRAHGLSGEVGLPLALDWADPATELSFRVRDPGGRESVIHVTRADPAQPAVLPGLSLPGFHRLECGGREVTVAVNLPTAETDGRYLQAEELALSVPGVPTYQATSWPEQQAHLAAVRHGRPLWPWLLSLAFVLAVIEVVFANRRSRTVAIPEVLRQFIRRGGHAA